MKNEEIEGLPASELDHLLSTFFLKAKVTCSRARQRKQTASCSGYP